MSVQRTLQILIDLCCPGSQGESVSGRIFRLQKSYATHTQLPLHLNHTSLKWVKASHFYYKNTCFCLSGNKTMFRSIHHALQYGTCVSSEDTKMSKI